MEERRIVWKQIGRFIFSSLHDTSPFGAKLMCRWIDKIYSPLRQIFSRECRVQHWASLRIHNYYKVRAPRKRPSFATEIEPPRTLRQTHRAVQQLTICFSASWSTSSLYVRWKSNTVMEPCFSSLSLSVLLFSRMTHSYQPLRLSSYVLPWLPVCSRSSFSNGSRAESASGQAWRNFSLPFFATRFLRNHRRRQLRASGASILSLDRCRFFSSPL